MAHTMELHDEPDVVPAVRRFVREHLRGTPLADRCDDAELILTELVTNASLHGAPPVTVRVDVSGDGARLEVEDGSTGSPVRPVSNPVAMTGRGLMLVEALSDRWGVDIRALGKTVWAELGVAEAAAGGAPAATPASTQLLHRPDEQEEEERTGPPAQRRYAIEMGDVPTSLLLEAKGQVDSVVREFTLVAGGAASGQTGAVSADLARLIETVTTRFAAARDSIKRQALASAVAGRERTHLVLRLPPSAAQAGREYLAALDEVDRYARAARLLTLETPPQHRAFRRWYVNRLIDQLTALEAGREPPPVVSFEQFLLDEYDIVSTAHRATDRAARLQHVTGSLAGAATREAVAAVVVSQGIDALEASGGALLIRSRSRFEVLAAVHYGEALLDSLRTAGVDAQLPAAIAARTGEAVWMESPEQRDALFPELRSVEPATRSLCAVPLSLAGRVLGVLRLSFDAPRLFDDEERAFVMAFAAQTAQALERAELYTSERRARAVAETAATRLDRLNHVTAALAGTSDMEQINQIVTEEAHRTMGAELSALCVVEDDRMLRTVEIRGAQPGTRQRWLRFPVDANLPASEVVRTNQPVVLHSRAEMERRYPALAGQARHEQRLVCVPLSVSTRTLGALTLTFLPPYVVDDDVVEALCAIGRQCALAIERARLVGSERAARQRAGFLAATTARVASSLDAQETLENLTDLIVPELAHWSAAYLTDEAGRTVASTAKHREPAMTLLMRRLQKTYPFHADTAPQIGEVLITGRRFRDAVVSAARREQLCALFGGGPESRALEPASVMAVPFVRRERILGGLLLARLDDPAFTDDELMLSTEIADRAAVALDNAIRFRRERDVALTLQRSLLPQVLPRVPGLALAWRYFPGATGTNVGGDWYDVIPLEHDRVALIIGDVMGRGLQAAAVMGQLRAAARAHVYAGLRPAEVLRRIDTELMRLEQEQIATALLGLLDPDTRTLTVASAGHLPPLVRTADGTVSYLDVVPGPPLGTGEGDYSELEVALPEGATVLLYTDGLVEDRKLPIDEGLATLAAAATLSREPELLCDRALVALGRDSAHDDDTAMLAVYVGTV